ncbi:MAG: DNA translocase FtsK 4TM domain-containing protein [Nitrospirae bacterium]|nr:DNA translocase FtsK 4TM domain-containing protein [Nitrospirota bacterium]
MDKSSRIKDEILGITASVAGLVILLSLLSHNPWDPSLFTYSHGKTSNLLGPFGAYVSDFLLQIIGYTAYALPVIFCFYGIRRLFDREKRPKLIIITAVVLLILSFSSLLNLIFGPNAGGAIGFVSAKASRKILSTTGSYLLFVPLAFITLMFLIPFSLMGLIKTLKSSREARPVVEEEMPPQIQEIPPLRGEPLPLPPEPIPKRRESKVMQQIKGDYELPGIELLKDSPLSKARPSREELIFNSNLLEKKLQDFSIEGKVTQVYPGPVVTLFEFEPAPGVKINRVISLADDLALALKAMSVRISPIAGRAALGIEVPNKEREDVFLKEILSSDIFRRSPSKLTFALGKDIFGTPVVADLGRMPHLLVAGATGSGKSVAINAMVLSLLYRANPKEIKMVMIDPKLLELSIYEDIPHLCMSVITSPKEAAEALRKMVVEMERRYRLLAEKGARNIDGYNKRLKADEEMLPYIVIFIDELADLMLVSAHDVEDSIARLAQMARAAGIHLILATQRPSVDVITGVIKANFSARISFQVSSKVDSRTVLDTHGAEQLLGKGDMLFVSPGSRTIRIHGAYVSEEEIRDVVNFIKAQGGPEYTAFESLDFEGHEEDEGFDDDRDELYQKAIAFAESVGEVSISSIQRRFKIGYNRAARIMDMMAEDGLVGPPMGAGKARRVIRRR